MQLELLFRANDGFVPVDYRPFVMSVFKGALSKLYKNVFNDIYSKDNIQSKSFTFSTYFQKSTMQNGKIILPTKRFKAILSSYDYSLIMYLYNSMLLRLNKTFAIPMKTSVTLTGVNIKDVPDIEKDEIKIQFLSPMLIRDRGVDKERYIDYQEDDFNEKLNIVTKNFIDTLDVKFSNEKIELVPVQPKRTVVKCMGLLFNSSYGTYILKGDPKLLTYLYKSGIGSRRGEGFGMFKVIE